MLKRLHGIQLGIETLTSIIFKSHILSCSLLVVCLFAVLYCVRIQQQISEVSSRHVHFDNDLFKIVIGVWK